MKMAGAIDTDGIIALLREAYGDPQKASAAIKDMARKEIAMVVRGKNGVAINCDVVDRGRRYARDQGEPEPNGSGEFRASQVGPQSGSNEGQTMDDEGEIEQLCEMLGIDPRADKEAYDWVVKRHRAAADRRRARDWGPGARHYDVDAVDRRPRGAHDARPRGLDDFFRRFPELRRITVQG